jgi:hypothetical protein
VRVVPFASVNVTPDKSVVNSPWHGPKGGIVPVKFVRGYPNPPMPSDTPGDNPLKFKLKETVAAEAGCAKPAKASNAATAVMRVSVFIGSPP